MIDTVDDEYHASLIFWSKMTDQLFYGHREPPWLRAQGSTGRLGKVLVKSRGKLYQDVSVYIKSYENAVVCGLNK